MFKYVTGLSLLFFTVYAGAELEPPHIELEMTSTEYRALLEASLSESAGENSDSLDVILRAGARNLSWIQKLNERRPEGRKFSFSSRETQGVSPIISPKKSNPTLILAAFEELKKNLSP